MELARKIGKVGGCVGCLPRLHRQPDFAEAADSRPNRLLLDGASPQQVDKVHLDIGMPMGPFQMTDLAGMDIGWHRDPARIDTIRDAFCSAGRFGPEIGRWVL